MRACVLAGIYLAALSANGWLAASAQSGVVICASPPLATTTSPRCSWEQLSASIAHGASWDETLEFVQLARHLRLETATDRILGAAARKMATHRLRGARAELARLAGWEVPSDEISVNAEPAVRLHLGIARTIARLGSEPVAALGQFGSYLHNLGDPSGLGDLHPQTRILAERLIGVVSRGRARESAWRSWRAAVATGSDIYRSEFGLSLGALTPDASVRAGWTRRVLDARVGSLSASYVYPAVAQMPRSARQRDALSLNCGALRPSSDYVPIDCSILAFADAWGRRDVAAALRAYRDYRSVDLGSMADLAAVRAAPSMLGFLRLIRSRTEFDALHARARQAVQRMGLTELEATLAVERSAFYRAEGRLDDAMETISRVPLRRITFPAAVERARVAMLASRRQSAAEWMERAKALSAAMPEGRVLYLLAKAELMPDSMTSDEWVWLSRASPPVGIATSVWRSVLSVRAAEAEGRTQEAATDLADLVEVLTASAGIRGGVESILLETVRASPVAGLPGLELRSWTSSSARQDEAIHAERGAEHLRQDLAEGDVLLVVRRIADRILVLRLTPTAASLHRVDVPASSIRRRLLLLADLLQSRDAADGWSGLAASLAGAIFGDSGVLRRVAKADRIFLVVDPEFAMVPFEVLLSTSFGRAPIPALGRATSLTALHTAWHQEVRAGNAVAFIPGLTRGALREIALMRDVTGATVYAGRRATKAALRRVASSARLLHYGGHSEPPRSVLVEGALELRAVTGNSWARLYSSEIESLPLGGALVVLMGCDTATPEVGPLSERALADAFLRAGSRAVVGNLWTIRDDEAAELAEIFYSEGGPEGGLAAVQRTRDRMRRRHPDSPASWAGLVWQGAPLLPAPVRD